MHQAYESSLASPSPSSTLDRQQQAQALARLDQLRAEGHSFDNAAKALGIPARTLRSWDRRRRQRQDERGRFFESPAGIELLQRIVVALQLLVGYHTPGGVRLLGLFLRLTLLEDFVAPSYGAQYKASRQLRSALVAFGEEEFKRLAELLPEGKLLCLTQDETFHSGVPCLVALDLLSDFLLVEQYAQDRSAQSWNEAVKPVLEKLPVKVLSSTIDGAKGLAAHVRDGLAVESSPDLFHPMREAGRAVVGPLTRRRKEAQKHSEVANKALDKESDGRSRRRLSRKAEEAQAEVEIALACEEEGRAALRSIAEVYHPVELDSGQLKSAEQVEGELTKAFERLRQVGQDGQLSQKAMKGLAKAEKVTPKLLAYFAFFLSFLATQLQLLDLEEAAQQAWKQLFSGFYLRLAAARSGKADKRAALGKRAEGLLRRARDALTELGLGPERLLKLERVAQRCASLFQRSSSAVEGRNGRLSLWRHGQRRLDGEKLAALTVIHNFWIKRADGTTAAERFFESKPRDLFEHLLSVLPLPARPAKKRKDPNIRKGAA